MEWNKLFERLGTRGTSALNGEQALKLYDALKEPAAFYADAYAGGSDLGALSNHEFMVVKEPGLLPLLRSLHISTNALVDAGLLYIRACDREIDEVSACSQLAKVGHGIQYNKFLKRDESSALFKVVGRLDTGDLRMYDDMAMLEIDRSELEAMLPPRRQGRGI